MAGAEPVVQTRTEVHPILMERRPLALAGGLVAQVDEIAREEESQLTQRGTLE
jgi:hypothetical protein